MEWIDSPGGFPAPSLGLVVLLAQLATTLYLTGIVWFVQVVHYPLFGAVGPAGFRTYADAHVRRTGWVVGPPMLAELGCAVLLLWLRPAGVPGVALVAGLGLLGVIWASTLGLQVPRHTRLRRGFHADAHRQLVRTNWIRTAAWTARSLLVLAMLAAAMGG